MQLPMTFEYLFMLFVPSSSVAPTDKATEDEHIIRLRPMCAPRLCAHSIIRQIGPFSMYKFDSSVAKFRSGTCHTP